MVCNEIQQNIEAYLDGELTLSDRRDFEEHLGNCNNCQLRLEAVRKLNTSIKKIGYSSRPSGLKRNIRAGLLDLSGEDSPGFNWSQLLGFSGASALFAGVGVWLVMGVMINSPLQLAHTDELISAHVRSLMVDHMTDIASSDRHTVKPWFNGKLDFSPNVVDFKDHGYPLVGGRLDYLKGRPTAALIYKRRAHVINLFVRKADTPAQITTMQLIQHQGYQLLNWQERGLTYTLVSDLNSKELQAFANKLQP
ncbi:MAG: anti-sigma factor [Gammaproteobacteria bacterium]|nr:anti-sigma factor [Gammaproteobacteria bacterium]